MTVGVVVDFKVGEGQRCCLCCVFHYEYDEVISHCSLSCGSFVLLLSIFGYPARKMHSYVYVNVDIHMCIFVCVCLFTKRKSFLRLFYDRKNVSFIRGYDTILIIF